MKIINIEFPNYYATTCGRVVNITTGKVLKYATGHNGYYFFTMCNGIVRKGARANRVVLQAYEGASNLEVNHKNKIKTDNRLSNLEYMTRIENQIHGLGTPVMCFDKSGNFIKEYNSISCAARLGHDKGNISKCCKGQRKTASGYVWKFKEEK